MLNEPSVIELLQAVELFPTQVECRLQLAEYLSSRNSPRGEFIAEQCKPESEQDQGLITCLLAKYGRIWTAQDLGIKESDIPEGASVEFHQGFAWFPVQAEFPNFQTAIDAGKYESVDKDISTTNFCLEDSPVSVSAKLVLYNPKCINDPARVIHVMRRHLNLNLNVDQIWDLCAFGATYSNIQCRFPIFALGAFYVNRHGSRYIPCLVNWFNERKLRPYCWDAGWHDDFRYLATRKQFSPPGTIIG